MKTLAIMYGLAIVLGVATFQFVNSTIDTLIAESKQEIGAQALQGGEDNESYVLQPAQASPRDYNPQGDQEGGNGQNIELQPAMGYRALQ